MASSLREKNKQRTRVAIVHAALELYIERGYDQTTVSMIAERAGVLPRTVSTYFPMKADIAVGPLETIFARLQACIDSRGPGQDTLDALQTWMQGEAEIGDETGHNLVRRAMAANPLLQVIERERMIRAEQLIAESLIEEHELSPGDIGPHLLASAALAMTFELWGHKHVKEPHLDSPHISDRVELIPYAIAMLREAEQSMLTTLAYPPKARTS